MTAVELEALAEALVADPAYARGRAAFPGRVDPDDAVALAAALHDTLDEGAAARAELLRQVGRPVACRAGCSACCEEPVQVFLPEALRIARWLERPENAAARAAFLEAYPRWKALTGDGPAALSDAFASGQDDAYRHAYFAEWRRRVLCAFNAGGLCTVYPVRPLVCRNAHAVDTAEHCRADDPSGTLPIRVEVPEIEAFMKRARGCLRAAHHALGGPRLRPTALPDAVHALLAT